MPTPPVIPVYLSGGGGSRLWPLSRGERPKQFLRLAGDLTLFQQAILRTADRSRFAEPIVVGSAAHAAIIREQLGEIGEKARLILEPFGRDTAPAVAAALLECLDTDESAIAFVMPTDHAIGDEDAFAHAAVRAALLARNDRLGLFGLKPSGPATGYGYIRAGAAIAGVTDAFEVESFVEKPDAAEAERLIAQGCLWNSGMFMMPARSALDEILDRAPQVYAGAEQAWAHAKRHADARELNADYFGHAPAISIDRALVEKTGRAAVVAADLQWADLGTWSALWAAGDKDADGALLSGDVAARDVKNVLVRAEGLPVAAIGVEDLVIVATPEGVLVCRRGREEEVKDLASEIARLTKDEQ
ncbi:MAG TPA: sugar phosphate nucleotidyltransferase [Caulobacteraceae bacterium]|nr:sugar phosphate nucleotidyltransferase [Caulobacteraceae bacterium]